MTYQPFIYSGMDFDTPSEIKLSGGDAVVFTRRAPGKTRDNEDSVAVIQINQKHNVLAVADGLGGLPKGAAASKRVVDDLAHGLNNNRNNTIEEIVNGCNNVLVSEEAGNATTLSVAEIRENELLTYQVGDSSVWVIGQQGKPKFRAPTHSPVGEALESGRLSEIDALLHSERNLVSNVIGSIDMYIDVGTRITLAPRDTVLVASDGLFDNLFEEEIIESVRKGPLPESAQTLVDQASERMKRWPPSDKTPAHPDDLSFILYRPI